MAGGIALAARRNPQVRIPDAISALYTTRVTAVGGRNGRITSEDGGGFALSVALAVTVAGIDQATADEIVQAAHNVCPYSNAVRGNIEVGISVAVR